jgi:hypothetical protein
MSAATAVLISVRCHCPFADPRLRYAREDIGGLKMHSSSSGGMPMPSSVRRGGRVDAEGESRLGMGGDGAAGEESLTG